MENIEKNIVPKSEENNNTLSIIDDSQSKEKSIPNQTQAQNENIPIKMKKYFKSAEEYYSYNYPEYELFKVGNILFCKMGNLITFYFDKNNNFKPKFSIGPNWYMTLVLNIMIIIISLVIYFLILRKLRFIFRITFIILAFLSIFGILRAALTHIEINMNKYQDTFHYLYCNKCNKYFSGLQKVEHCDLCKVCVIKYDHHCVWVGKCVGKGNFHAFSHMIIFGGIFYLFLIACVIIYNMK